MKTKRERSDYRPAVPHRATFRPLTEDEKLTVQTIYQRKAAEDSEFAPELFVVDRLVVAYVQQGRWKQFTVAIVGYEDASTFLIGVSRRDKRDKTNRMKAEALAFFHAIEGDSGFVIDEPEVSEQEFKLAKVEL